MPLEPSEASRIRARARNAAMSGEVDKNCLACSRYAACKDERKAWNYVCRKFLPMSSYDTLLSDIEATFAASRKSETASTGFKPPEEEEFDLERMVNDALSQDNSAFTSGGGLRIDDRDIPKAPNFFTFLTDPKFLSITPFAKQLEIGVNLFSEYCPKCSDNEFVSNVPVGLIKRKSAQDGLDEFRDRVQLLEFGICPRCKSRRSEMVAEGLLHIRYELAGLAGQRSSKSILVGMIGAYSHHCFLKMHRPAVTFGLLPNSVIMARYVALTFAQVKNNLWEPMMGYFTDTPWYNQYHACLDFYAQKHGEEIYAIKDTFIKYRHKNMLSFPSVPNKKTMRGSTSFGGGIDEVGWFNANKSDSVKMDADEVYTAMQNSFGTLVGAHGDLVLEGKDDIPPPIFCNVSSPASRFDKITQLYNQSQTSYYIYGFKYATWEMNPTLPRNGHFISNKFASDPEIAMRDFGAEPPMSSSAFISDINHVRVVADPNKENGVRIKHKKITTESGRVQTSGVPSFLWTDKTVPRLMSLDAGYSNNSFACSLGHVDRATRIPRIDVMFEIVPSPGYPLNYTDIYLNVLKPVMLAFNVVHVISDRWQSIKLLQDMERDLKVGYTMYSLRYADFDSFRQDTYDKKWRCPKPEMKVEAVLAAGDESYPAGFADKPLAHFVFQCITVVDHPGKSVEKGEKTTDDLFRTAVLQHYFLTSPEHVDKFLGEGSAGRAHREIGRLVKGGGKVSNTNKASKTTTPKAGLTGKVRVMARRP
jgi:hypothetical protein